MRYSSLRFTPLLLAFFAGIFAACSTPLPVDGCDDPGPVKIRGQETGIEFCTNGPRHRVRAQACPILEPPAGQCHLDPMNEWSCETNVACNALGRHNVCVFLNDSTCMCAFSCVTDEDCGEDEFCSCDEPTSSCRKALCRSDADCDEGRMCASAEFVSSGGKVGLACQSELDECLIHRDCPDLPRCVYDEQKGHRICSNRLD